MGMIKKVGTEYEAGMFAVSGNITQSGSKEASGDIRVFRNHEGKVASVYKVDAGTKKVQFEGLLESTASLPKKGDPLTLTDGQTSVRYRVESADLIYKNDDAQKIRITAIRYADLVDTGN